MLEEHDVAVVPRGSPSMGSKGAQLNHSSAVGVGPTRVTGCLTFRHLGFWPLCAQAWGFRRIYS